MAAVIRTLDNNATCPGSLSGEVHEDSNLFSGALWSVRSALAGHRPRGVRWRGAGRADGGPHRRRRLRGPRRADRLQRGNLRVGCERCPSHERRADEARGATDLQARDRVHGQAGQRPQLRPGWRVHRARAFHRAGRAVGSVRARSDPDPRHAEGRAPPASRWCGPTRSASRASTVDRGIPTIRRLLVRFAADPIQISYDSPLVSNAGDPVEVQKQGDTYRAEIPIPDGSTDVYVMIVNRGDRDAMYRAVTLDAPAPKPPPIGGSGGIGSTGGFGGARGKRRHDERRRPRAHPRGRWLRLQCTGDTGQAGRRLGAGCTGPRPLAPTRSSGARRGSRARRSSKP